ncbi:QVPTGV class sortase B protein-sorting domain-containing protein [Streptococcus dysgalactiae]|uniref:T antigen/fimbrial major structural protein Tee11 n=1 Tax=Streptococcus dysgalactiae subsp. equisimilis TaxID=119602 RepID=A0AAE9U1E8_STREQ|nr:QVPTGV class sortase B protein-sorting domain-containing protein [Streptococcus dysgalactiae]VTT17160.1 T antigen/fimbrial major structural protein Tee11 [Streptococcus dysgalactiae]VTT23871.1 T antigen/fimbrial major structural protein Tee11 [Streptococcus dysgalactiae subsp. equisimilis]
MKKQKLLFATAILLTALGTGSMSQNVKAETAGVTDGAKLIVTKTFPDYVDSSILMPKLNYKFQITAGDTGIGMKDKSGLEIISGVTAGLTTEQTIAYDNSVKPSNKSKTATFDFSKVSFPNVGVYRYNVIEVDEHVEGITYDTKKWTVDVYVVEEGGKFIPKYIVSTESGTDKKSILFNNSFKTTSLKVQKKVTGIAGDKKQAFKFKLLLVGNDYFVDGQEVALTKITTGGKESLSAIIGQEYTFELKDNEQVLLDKLPVGITYKIDEIDKNKDNYKTQATLTKDGGKSVDYTLNADKKTDFTADTIVVTNTRDIQVPTGVVGTLAPFVALSIVAIGGVLYITKRKKA